ncbi:hypothetical protein Y032_0020g78 [Ancylostoma ceylanicum]|uniref:SCP domain-containing protein n=1 Tax=Ancylostoma ceylanicum TaxID=53326 RepID=A0A016V0P6_9BILA|nr:hypothetical protein Y032_0020g78 [Ancylostoma ceylanicum]
MSPLTVLIVCVIYLLPTSYSETECKGGPITKRLREMLEKEVQRKFPTLTYNCEMEKRADEAANSTGKEQSEQTIMDYKQRGNLNMKKAIKSWDKEKIGDKTKFGCTLKGGEEYKIVCAFE